MRQVEKSEKIAVKFHEEIDWLDSKGLAHEDYGPGPFRREYYEDVFMNLIISQKGLCAYTEELITSKTVMISQNWENGKYSGAFKRKDFDSTIDHYDSKLKHDNRGWLYSNLFAVKTFINTHKLTKHSSTLFKPDRVDYDPRKYLEYNYSFHMFVPNRALIQRSPEMLEPIREMIDSLGINLQTIIDSREAMLSDFKIDIENGQKTYEEIKQSKVKKFFTAFEMSENDLCS